MANSATIPSFQRETNRETLIPMLDSCLTGLPYHRHRDFIIHAINLISNTYQRPSTHTAVKSKLKNILLSMLSCVDVVVRRETYKYCCDVLKQSFKHSHVTNPMSTLYTKAWFIIDRDVIHVVCAFGMAGQDDEVRARHVRNCMVNSCL